METLEKLYNKLEFLDSFLEKVEIKSARCKVFAEIYQARKEKPPKINQEFIMLLKMSDTMAKLEKDDIFSRYFHNRLKNEISECETMIDKVS